MTTDNFQPIVIEAEDLDYDRGFYRSFTDRNASGGQIIRAKSYTNDGNATTVFSGADGTYTLTLDVYDENDGRGQIFVYVNGQEVSQTTLGRNLGSDDPTSRTRTQINIENLGLKRGDTIRLRARRDGGERTSLDKLTFTPVGVTTPDVAITSNGGGNFAVVNIDENTQSVTDFEVNVGDENVTYQINDGADRDLFEIDVATGALRFRSAPDWETPLDADGDNVYDVTVAATGANNNSDSQRLSVVVDDVAESAPPSQSPPSQAIVVEAEDLDYDRGFYRSFTDRNASGGQIIRAKSYTNDGNATTVFSGADGTYTLTLDVYDENDGRGQIFVYVNGQEVSQTTLGRNLGSDDPTSRTRTQINIENLGLKRGDTIRLRARRDGGERTSLDKLTFTPVGVTTPDVAITSNGGGNFAVVNIDENTQSVTDFEVNVGDENVTYQINDGADRDLFEIDVATGALRFRSAPDWETPLDADDNNVYEVNVVATGANNSGDGQFLSVVVDDVEESAPPSSPDVVITSNGGGNSAVVNINENTQAVTDFEVNVGDENVTYQINDGADRDLFEIDVATGALRFRSAPDWETPLDADGNNVYEVNVVAIGDNNTDGDGQFLSVVVNDVEESGPPQGDFVFLNSAANFLVQEGKRYVTDINANDAEDGDILYRINAGADVDLFEIDAQTGVLSFKQAPDWENPLDSGAGNAIAGDNNYEVNVLALRGNQATSKFLTVTVSDVSDEAAAPASVYLMGGQSNLVGVAELENLSDSSFLEPFPAAQIWNRSGGNFVDLNPAFERSNPTRLGPELSFGRGVAAGNDQDVYLVKYGLGSTDLAENWNPDNTGEQYRTFVNTVDEALASLAQSGIAYELDGFVWQQGESDTYTDSFAPAYEDNLLQFVGRVRELYGEALDISLGLLRNDLPTSANNRDLVRAAQTAVANADPNIVLVDTDALGSASEVLRVPQNDLTHYNADGQIALGFAHADALLG